MVNVKRFKIIICLFEFNIFDFIWLTKYFIQFKYYKLLFILKFENSYKYKKST